MFKATFPWAELYEEELERKYIKSLDSTSPDETAGNVWIPPLHALELAAEYQITSWIEALLDNQPIEVNPSKDAAPKTITPPPKFLKPHDLNAPASPPARSRRSASPSKIASPKKLAASPRKQKTAKASTSDAPSSPVSKKASKTAEKPAAEVDEKDASATNKSTSSLPSGISEVVKVTVDSDVLDNGDNTETTHTHVEVEMPASLPDLPLPDDTEAMIAKAKEMVEAAVEVESAAAKGSKNKRSSKRKAAAVQEEEEEDVKTKETAEGAGPAAKKAKIDPKAESELKKEIVKKRALIGISATLALGYVSSFLFLNLSPTPQRKEKS